MEPLIVLFVLVGIVFAVFLAFVISGSVLRLVARMAGVDGITLGNAMLTTFLAGLAVIGVTVPILLLGWREPFSLWILGVVVQGAVIRRRFCIGLVSGIIIAVVVAIVWLVIGLILGGPGLSFLKQSGRF